MKKRFLVAATAMLSVGALTMFAGCGETTGEISGKYKEATADEVIKACADIEFDDSFGDLEQVGWTYNLQAEEEATAKLDFTMGISQNGMTGSMNYKMEMTESAEYLVSIAHREEGFENWGAGSFKATAEGSMNMSGLTTSVNYDEEMKVYHDTDNVYLDPVKSSQLVAGKTKVSIEDILDMIKEEVPDFPTNPQFPTELEKPDKFSDLVQELVENGVKISLDQRKGLKIKLSLGKETVEAMLAAQTGEDAEISFKTFVLDVYFSFDKDGMFEGAGVVYDIDMTVSVALPEASMTGKIVLEGGLSLKVTNETAKLPSGIATDTSYLPLDLNEGSFLPGIM